MEGHDTHRPAQGKTALFGYAKGATRMNPRIRGTTRMAPLAARHVHGGNPKSYVGQNIAVTVLTISIAAVLVVCSIGCNAPAISRIATITAITMR